MMKTSFFFKFGLLLWLLAAFGGEKRVVARILERRLSAPLSLRRSAATRTTGSVAIARQIRGGGGGGVGFDDVPALVGQAMTAGIALQGTKELINSVVNEPDPDISLMRRSKGICYVEIALTVGLIYLCGDDLPLPTIIAYSVIPRFLLMASFMIGVDVLVISSFLTGVEDLRRVQVRFIRLVPAYLLLSVMTLAILDQSNKNPFQLEALTAAKAIGLIVLVAGSFLFSATNLCAKLLCSNFQENPKLVNPMAEQGILDMTEGAMKLALLLDHQQNNKNPTKSLGKILLFWFVLQCINFKGLKRKPGGTKTEVHTQLIAALVGGIFLTCTGKTPSIPDTTTTTSTTSAGI